MKIFMLIMPFLLTNTIILSITNSHLPTHIPLNIASSPLICMDAFENTTPLKITSFNILHVILTASQLSHVKPFSNNDPHFQICHNQPPSPLSAQKHTLFNPLFLNQSHLHYFLFITTFSPLN